MFSLFAYSELLDELPRAYRARLVLPPRPPADAQGTEPDKLGLLGTAADRPYRNTLQAPWLARKLAAWLAQIAEVRHAHGAIPQGTLVLWDGQGRAQQAALGSFSFSTDAGTDRRQVRSADQRRQPKAHHPCRVCRQGEPPPRANRALGQGRTGAGQRAGHRRRAQPGNPAGLRRDLTSILSGFSQRSKERPEDLPHEGELDILIATDCISEGQNLQDWDWLINDDIHWNPVRIIQRFGRIGSTNTRIQRVNFWPNMELEEYINLEQRVSGRMVLLDISAIRQVRSL